MSAKELWQPAFCTSEFTKQQVAFQTRPQGLLCFEIAHKYVGWWGSGYELGSILTPRLFALARILVSKLQTDCIRLQIRKIVRIDLFTAEGSSLYANFKRKSSQYCWLVKVIG